MGGEEARNEVDVVALCGDDDAAMAQVDLVEFGAVDADGVDGVLVGVNEDVIAGFQDFGGCVVECVGDGVREESGLGRTRGEVHLEAAVVGLAHGQGATGGREADRRGVGREVVQDGVGAGQGGVAAEVHFDVGGEPAEVVVRAVFSFRSRDDVSGFGDRHFLCHPEHPLVFGPTVEGDDAGRVAAKGVLGEGVNAEALHGAFGWERGQLASIQAAMFQKLKVLSVQTWALGMAISSVWSPAARVPRGRRSGSTWSPGHQLERLRSEEAMRSSRVSPSTT